MKQIYFGQRISQLRRENGMTQETLAQKLGISNQAVSKWESDQCCPDIMQLPQLADLFGITLDALFGRTQAEKTALCAVASLPWEDDNSLRAVCFLGRRLLEAQELPHHSQALEKVQLNFQGAVEDVKSAFSVYCPGTAIGGDVKAGDGVTCGDVKGSVTAGDSVTCGNIGANAKAGDSIECAGNIGGNASAGGEIHCGKIEGAARAGGNLYTTNE